MAPPDSLKREKVEEALPPSVRQALPALLRAWGIRDSAVWPEHPIVADMLSLTAVQALQEENRRRMGVTWPQALRFACGALGLRYEAVRKRIARNRTIYLEARSEMADKSSPAAPNH